jgi:hypothetical protein
MPLAANGAGTVYVASGTVQSPAFWLLTLSPLLVLTDRITWSILRSKGLFMDKKRIITGIAQEVRRRLENEGSGHDWWHVYRVWKMAQRIGKEESADMFVVELTALLHDVAD